MKRSIKKMSALLTMMAIAILTFTFTACNDDEENTNIEVTYTYGFSEMSASHPDFLAEMSKIEKGFQAALGITGKPFTKKGTIEECDKQVYEACQKASIRSKARRGKGIIPFRLRTWERERLYVLLHFVLTTKTLYNSINSMTNNEM